MGVFFLTTSPVHVCVVVVGVLCLVTSPAWVHVGEPVVPCFLMIGLLLRASAYNFMALATSASLVMVDIELVIEVCEEMFEIGCCGFVGV